VGSPNEKQSNRWKLTIARVVYKASSSSSRRVISLRAVNIKKKILDKLGAFMLDKQIVGNQDAFSKLIYNLLVIGFYLIIDLSTHKIHNLSSP
jgi:hypothetical protein